MNRLTIVFTLLLLSFTTLTSGLAKNLNIEEIAVDLEAIQVGAFKERKNILQQKQLFSNYNSFIEYGEKFSRLYIVNIKKEDYQRTLSEVKKSNPSAFRASEKIRRIVDNNIPIKTVLEDIEMKNNVYHNSTFLNSNTILKTRKKFF